MSKTTKTRVLRGIMRKYGKNSIFTNLYKTCRTVKCYEGRDAGNDACMINELLNVGFDINVKMVYGRTYRGGIGSIIARVSLDNEVTC